MSDFKKGLLVGILIIIGCGTFIAATSKQTSKDRYMPVKDGNFLLDKWYGRMYVMNPKSDDGLWELIYSVPPIDYNWFPNKTTKDK